MKDLVLIGRQGSGKGTQGRILAEHHGFTVFETGAALREMAKQPTELGATVREITARGDLVPNGIVMKILANFLSLVDKDKPVLFDGIPRSEEQRKSFTEELEKAGRSFMALEIRISNNEAVKRLLKRGQLEGREDDNLTAIQNRLQNFESQTQPVINFWEESGQMIVVNGEQEIEEVTKEMEQKLGLS